MRVLLAASLLLALLATASAPTASASAAGLPEAQCDIDDDLVQHCNVDDVHVVYSLAYKCVGVRVGGPAECRPILSVE